MLVPTGKPQTLLPVPQLVLIFLLFSPSYSLWSPQLQHATSTLNQRKSVLGDFLFSFFWFLIHPWGSYGTLWLSAPGDLRLSSYLSASVGSNSTGGKTFSVDAKDE